MRNRHGINWKARKKSGNKFTLNLILFVVQYGKFWTNLKLNHETNFGLVAQFGSYWANFRLNFEPNLGLLVIYGNFWANDLSEKRWSDTNEAQARDHKPKRKYKCKPN